MKTVIEMAREAGLIAPNIQALTRFAALVREDERERNGRGDYMEGLEEGYAAGQRDEREKQQEPVGCQGTNCGTTVGDHSLECLCEAAIDQRWDDMDKYIKEPALQQPIAWMSPSKERLEFSRRDTVYGSHTLPLYTTPPTAAIAARQMRDAAVKVCLNGRFLHDDAPDARFGKACGGAIASLPVPEVQWRDLTDDDIADVFWDDFSKQREEDYTWNDVARAVIAKFKEKQL